MTFAKITIAALITVVASTSMAGTYCPHKDRNSMFANTNPVVKTVKAATSNTQAATR
ncbi:hypothetical protein [Bdellovibrio bacteriovorus]|uniref:hypothetical protein n=1 Tax=Bdellovibrio bacteriovorus TaxID=959 RepID=UPI000AC89683|nr:hypothetical protein [Bdellovibrio bacteriovorus]